MSTENTNPYNVVDNTNELFKLNPSTSNINNLKGISIEPSNTFEDKIKNFISNNKICLYILTPCYGGMCYVNYLHCVMATKELLSSFGITVYIEFCKNDSLVSRARNNLVARAMANPKTTHIIFIDNDITWTPSDVLRLLVSDKQLIGGVYPLKRYNWDRLIEDKGNPYNTNIVQTWLNKKNQSQIKNFVSDEQFVQHKLLRYNVNYLSDHLEIDNNLTKVKHLATGFMMFKRDLIEKMCRAFPSTKYSDDVGFLNSNENEFAYALFDCGVEEGHYLSEDWLFCNRWTKMGGDVWIDISVSLSHTGTEDYVGSYISSIL
jgi:hypothetical protein